MTAIGDKLKAAGYDTLGSEFCVRATEALKTHGSVREAWRGLGDTWGHVVLTRIWSDMRGTASKELGDHPGLDTQRADVPRKGEGGSQLISDAHSRDAAALPTPASKEPKPFFKQKGKSQTDKLISQSARLTGSSIWKELKIDRLRVREADAFMHEEALAVGNDILKNKWRVKRLALVWLTRQHGVAAMTARS